MRVDHAVFAFFARRTADLDREGARFILTPAEIATLNPNTETCPIFRSRRDAEITLGVYRRLPVLVRTELQDGNPWSLSFMTMYHMSNDSELFNTAHELSKLGWVPDGSAYVCGQERMLPLYEAKMVHHYDHRWATFVQWDCSRETSFAEHDDPSALAMPRYWVAESEIDARLAGRWDSGWLLGFRNISGTEKIRTIIPAAMPFAAVGHSMPLILSVRSPHLLCAALSSFALDYVARQKVGGVNMTYNFVNQFPVPPPEWFDESCSWDVDRTTGEWMTQRIIELTYTAWDMHRFAEDCGDVGPPFRWSDDRRAILRSELDGAFSTSTVLAEGMLTISSKVFRSCIAMT